jgi:hypothetical protein
MKTARYFLFLSPWDHCGAVTSLLAIAQVGLPQHTPGGESYETADA